MEVYQVSRIESDEKFAMDIEWYGIDKKGNVAVFCSAGEANVPEFVCANRERYEQLVELFDKLPCISDVQICFECSNENMKPLQVAKEFSEKGLFYYDSDDFSKSKRNIGVFQEYYTIGSIPINPIKYADLPKQIQIFLKGNFMPVDDFGTSTIIEVEDAYNH